MTRVLITGAAGALGQAVLEQLSKTNHYEIFATTFKTKINLNSALLIECDIRNIDQFTDVMNIAQPQLILHMAASFTEDLAEAYLCNVVPAKNILEWVLKRKSTTRVVLVGSAAEYGAVKPEENPIREDQALFPVSAYGVSKAWQTQLVGFYSSRDVDVVCARIFNLYGPWLSQRLFAGRVQNQISAIKAGNKSLIEVGPLSAVRDYLSTSEAACQLLEIANKGESGNLYHIGSGMPVTMREFLIKQLHATGLDPSLIHEEPSHSNRNGYDVPVIFADMQKTHMLLNT